MRLVYILMKEARKRGADCLATVCPLCQFNLDAYHAQVTREFGVECVPTLYFSQLMGLAFGLPEKELGLNRLILPFKWRPSAASPRVAEPVTAAATTARSGS
jgi:heterodisulfide reductase subunit B